MRLIEIENWALSIIQQVISNQPNEDSRVELKTTWIKPYKAARQIAGHANSSHGDPILWLIGVDEKTGVVGVKHKEFASWFMQVSSCFDGHFPEIKELNIQHNGKTIVALFIRTNRAPFVVKNPKFGSANGTPISLEVPWREGTSTRSAKRSDLIRLLVPRLSLPEVEILNAELYIKKHDEFKWSLTLNTYIIPVLGHSVVIPFHRSSIYLSLPDNSKTLEMSEIKLAPPYKNVYGGFSPSRFGSAEPDSYTAINTQNEIIIEGPSVVKLSAHAWTPEPPDIELKQNINLQIELRPVHTNNKLNINENLIWNEIDDQKIIAEWILHP